MNLHLFSRDLVTPKPNPPVELTVERFSRSVFGGPKAASISARGFDLDLWSLLELLRCPIVIDAPEGDSVWWGFISEVQANVRASFAPNKPRIKVAASLDSMSNRIAVAYSTANLSGEEVRGTTNWDDLGGNDYVSQGEYGVKELLWTLSSATPEHAEAARDKRLTELRYPQPSVALDFDSSESQAVIFCKGWWSTLDWKYCQVPLQLALAYTTVGNVVLDFGDNDIGMVAQEISFVAEVNIAAIGVYLRKSGDPQDSVEVSIYSAVDGIPDTELASGSIDVGDITTDFAWLTVAMSSSYLASSGIYFLRIARSGGQDADNFYQLSEDTNAGYIQGKLLIFEDPDWNIPDPQADIPFQIYSDDLVETTQQITSYLRNYGQFFKNIFLQNQSGISIESYRDGDSTALFEVLQLLQMGTTNHRRLLTNVDINRRVTIYEEPALPVNSHILFSDGTIAEPNKQPIRNCVAPVGVWARWSDVIPTSLNTSRLADPALVFIDEVEYDVALDRFSITPRGASNPFDFAKVADG